jgi:DNA transposition AAA+ family ATPase
MITGEQQQKIVAVAREREALYGSATRFAKYLDINPAIWSRLKAGETEGVLSHGKWVSMARKLGLNLGNEKEWITANTPVYQFVTAQLEVCQQQRQSSMLCDASDIGKTYAARVYAATHRNVAYVDCSQAKSKQQLVKCIANAFGVGSNARYSELYADLVAYVKAIESPLIILDEAGDLSHSAFLEIKALWNAVSNYCGFYMIGADGLEALMRRSIEYKRVGYTELFSRFGKKYGSVFRPDNYTDPDVRNLMTDRETVLRKSAAMIIKANMANGDDVNRILNKAMGDDRNPSLRRIYDDLSKTTGNEQSTEC